MRHTIIIRKGKLRAIYTDKLPFHNLGVLTVVRASNVEWDNARQGWTVELADGTKLPGVWKNRQEALDAEVEAVNARL